MILNDRRCAITARAAPVAASPSVESSSMPHYPANHACVDSRHKAKQAYAQTLTQGTAIMKKYRLAFISILGLLVSSLAFGQVTWAPGLGGNLRFADAYKTAPSYQFTLTAASDSAPAQFEQVVVCRPRAGTHPLGQPVGSAGLSGGGCYFPAAGKTERTMDYESIVSIGKWQSWVGQQSTTPTLPAYPVQVGNEEPDPLFLCRTWATGQVGSTRLPRAGQQTPQCTYIGEGGVLQTMVAEFDVLVSPPRPFYSFPSDCTIMGPSYRDVTDQGRRYIDCMSEGFITQIPANAPVLEWNPRIDGPYPVQRGLLALELAAKFPNGLPYVCVLPGIALKSPQEMLAMDKAQRMRAKSGVDFDKIKCFYTEYIQPGVEARKLAWQASCEQRRLQLWGLPLSREEATGCGYDDIPIPYSKEAFAYSQPTTDLKVNTLRRDWGVDAMEAERIAFCGTVDTSTWASLNISYDQSQCDQAIIQVVQREAAIRSNKVAFESCLAANVVPQCPDDALAALKGGFDGVADPNRTAITNISNALYYAQGYAPLFSANTCAIPPAPYMLPKVAALVARRVLGGCTLGQYAVSYFPYTKRTNPDGSSIPRLWGVNQGPQFSTGWPITAEDGDPDRY